MDSCNAVSSIIVVARMKGSRVGPRILSEMSRTMTTAKFRTPPAVRELKIFLY